MELAGVCPTLDYTVSRENVEEGLRFVVRKLVAEFSNLDDEDFQISSLTGGTTNILYLVSSPKVPQRAREIPIVVRLYGHNTESIIDRKKELVVQNEAYTHGLGPKLYGVYNNGCVYAYLVGRVLELDEIHKPEIYKLVAKEIAEWHKLDFSIPKIPSLWDTLEKWIRLAPGDFSDSAKSAKYKNLDIANLRKEAESIEAMLKRLDSPVVFCHNDLLNRNIVLLSDHSQVTFIDYEYAHYNPRGFDIGNHLNEFAGFEADYSKYPKKQWQLGFLRSYLEFYKGAEVSNGEVEDLFVEVNCFSLASNLFWGFWALLQAQNSDIEFDFLEYAGLRFSRYFATKDEFLDLYHNKVAQN